MDMQKFLDDWLAANPDAQKYVERLYYLPPVPADCTHVLTIASATSGVRALMIGAAVLPPYNVLVEAFLSLVATAPPPVPVTPKR